MPRRYHSPSSIALGLRCPRAWAEQYLSGVREPDRPWVEIDSHVYDRASQLWRKRDGSDPITTRQRSTSLGKAVHATYEAWYRRQKPNWSWFPGKIAHSGAHLLPHPDHGKYMTECAIGSVPLLPDPTARADAPTQALAFGGLLWAGYRDLVAFAPDELRRLEINAPDGVALIDFKSTANARPADVTLPESQRGYALTSAQLEIDVQANLYAIDVCTSLGLDAIPAGWIYLETKKRRFATRTDATLTLARATDIIDTVCETARTLDTYTCNTDAPQNPLACGDYGPPGKINCEHHTTNGGACNARRSTGALIQARTKKVGAKIMAMDPAVKARFEAQRAKAAAGGTATAADPTTTAEETSAPAEPTAGPAANEPATATPSAVTSKFKGKGKRSASAPAGDGPIDAVIALQAELADAHAACAQANANRAEVLSKLQAALAEVS